MINLTASFETLSKDWAKIYASGQYTEGHYRGLLEEEVRNYTGLHAVAVSSAGAGLFALYSLMSRRYPAATKVLAPNNTFFATGAMAIEAGYDVVLGDCDKRDFSLSAEVVDTALRLGGDIAGVVLTHVGGGLAQDYHEISEVCRRYGVWLIEDAAHALGTRVGNMTPGWLSDAAVYSLYPTKAVPAGEGGIVVTQDAALADRVRRFVNYGKQANLWGEIEYVRGFNLRMDEWTSAVAYRQMQCVDEIMAVRRASAERLKRLIAEPIIHPRGGVSNWYKYPVSAITPAAKKTGKIYSRSDQLTVALNGAYPGRVTVAGSLEHSLALADSHICLPVENFSHMTDGELIQYIKG